ncbi:MAG: hypothetical protein AVDCRST_MAG71-293 [uncultured Lysobacter sp.]|uniref:Uncharacterized protein n=1 Tax=uncultured Lysobacter sp. TaxID=271060 RepID=A0A6J4KGJ5_9GAMM|nr:MAG: hypothetical protein AVDCRST_MAG71-293 [uncultured Lysobacter sp.]
MLASCGSARLRKRLEPCLRNDMQRTVPLPSVELIVTPR